MNVWCCATGRRKTSVARVYIKPGQRSEVIINGRPLECYFPRKAHQEIVKQPMSEVCWFPVVLKVNVMGGGSSGQASAIRLGVSRALVNYNSTLRSPLAKLGLLTRDPREVERKKVGKPKARKSKQFSKR